MQSIDWQRQNTELWNLISRMASVSGVEKRRHIFRQEIFRAFVPSFFPAMIQLTVSIKDEKHQTVIQNILLVAAVDVQDYLSQVSLEAVQPSAICAGLIAADIASVLSGTSDEKNAEINHAFVEQMKVVIRFADNIQRHEDAIQSEFTKIIEASRMRQKISVSTDALKGFSDSIHFLQRRISIAKNLLIASEGTNLTNFTRDQELVSLVGGTLAQALDEMGDRAKAAGLIENLVFKGFGIDEVAIDHYLIASVSDNSLGSDDRPELAVLTRNGVHVLVPTLNRMIAQMQKTDSSGGTITLINSLTNILTNGKELLVQAIQTARSDNDQKKVEDLVSSIFERCLQDPNRNLRIITALCCGEPIVPINVVKTPLIRLFAKDTDSAVKYAAAVGLSGDDNPDEKSRTITREVIFAQAKDGGLDVSTNDINDSTTALICVSIIMTKLLEDVSKSKNNQSYGQSDKVMASSLQTKGEFCPHCGKPTPDNSRFCAFCGSKVQ